MLYITSPWLVYFINEFVWLHHFAHSLPSASGDHQSVICIYEFDFLCLDFTLSMSIIPQFKKQCRKKSSPIQKEILLEISVYKIDFKKDFSLNQGRGTWSPSPTPVLSSLNQDIVEKDIERP